MSSMAVIVAAAGQSSRFKDGNYKKPFAILNQKAVWLHSVERFLNRSDVKQVIIVIAAEDREDFCSRFGANLAVMGIDLVLGGEHRCDSIQNGLSKVDPKHEFVCVHDAARPCVTDEWIESVVVEARASGAAILATPIQSTIKRSRNGRTVDETVSRENLFLAQTPQVFRRDLLVSAYMKRGDFQPTDEAQLVERMGHKVSLVIGSPLNIKITTTADMSFAAACLKALPAPKFDAPLHPFSDDKIWR